MANMTKKTDPYAGYGPTENLIIYMIIKETGKSEEYHTELEKTGIKKYKEYREYEQSLRNMS